MNQSHDKGAVLPYAFHGLRMESLFCIFLF